MITGEQFLHELNPGLQASPEVEAVADYLRQNGERIPNEPARKIDAYVGFLATVVNDGILTNDTGSIQRQVAHNAIQPDHIPDSYFERLQRITREQGRGELVITPADRKHAAITITNQQRHSLDKWAEYLSDETSDFPDWFKLYAFKAVTRMGKYNAGLGEYQKRSATTTAPYPALDEAVVANVYKWLKRAKLEGQEVVAFRYSEKEHAFQRALKNSTFAKLYALGMQAKHAKRGEVITDPHDGTWVTYPQRSSSKTLFEDLQGFNLDWCTALEQSTAADHIAHGDFYVYFMADTHGNHTVPHIAIRMDDNEVAEVRGIRVDQEMEPELCEVVLAKVTSLPGGENYFQKVADMKRLTAIEAQFKTGRFDDLTEDDLVFLYQIDRKIEGFGYADDPRIAELTKLHHNSEGETALKTIARFMGMSEASDDHDALMRVMLSRYDHLVPVYIGAMHQLSALTLDDLWWSESFLAHLEKTTGTPWNEAFIEYVLDNIDKFEDISSSFAREIASLSLITLFSLDHKFGPNIRRAINFDTVRGHQIYEYEIGAHIFAKHLPYFINIDLDTAKLLLDNGEDAAVLSNLYAFSSIALTFIDKYFIDKQRATAKQ